MLKKKTQKKQNMKDRVSDPKIQEGNHTPKPKTKGFSYPHTNFERVFIPFPEKRKGMNI